MNERTAKLRQASLDAVPSISAERACLLTDFYRDNEEAVQWIGESDWVYDRTFVVPASRRASCSIAPF